MAALALSQKLWSRWRDTGTESIGKFVSLAIYGDQDIFASAKKIRDWSEQLKNAYGPTFSSVEIAGAGHFWVEQGVEKQLRATLRGWVVEVSSDNASPSITQTP
jgi:alpha/beta superfamily hydrolase